MSCEPPQSYKVVPWNNRREWERLYKSIFSENLTDKQWALNRIAIWKSRSDRGLPGPVEATAALVRAQLWKERQANDGPSISSLSYADLEPQYGVALVKFVSDIIEPVHIQLNCGMKEAGLSLGIPDWIVDLRNEMAHSSSKALIDVLHSASVLLLCWLRQHYWEDVRSSFEEKDVPNAEHPLELPASETFIYTLLNQYREASMRMCSHGRRKPNKAFRDNLCSALSQISAVLPSKCDEVIKYLLTSDCLLEEAAADLYTAERAAKEFCGKASQCPLPSRLRHLWGPLVALLRSDVQHLAECLSKVEHDEQKSVTQKYLAAAWLLYIVNSSDNSCLLEGDPSFDHMPLRSHLNIPRLLKLALQYTGCYTMHIVKGLVPYMIPRLTEKQQYNLFALVAIQSGSVTDEEKLMAAENNFDDYTYTTEDLLEIDGEEEKSASESSWKLSSGVDWEGVPVGVVPGCQDETPNLDLNFRELRPVTQSSNGMGLTMESSSSNKDMATMECDATFDSTCKPQQLLECVHSMIKVFV